MRAHALIRQLLQHIGSYLELGVAAAVECRSAWARRALFLLLAMACGFAGLAALWVAGLVALWPTPWRLTYVVASAAVLLGTAIVAAYCALAERAGPSTRVLKAELHKDLELLQEWRSTL